MLGPSKIPSTTKRPDSRAILIIGALFFVFGFVTWLGSVLIPYLKIACKLNNFEAYLVAFSFYISYLIAAVPAAWLLKKTGFKRGISYGLLIMAAGTLLFIPAAMSREYVIFLLGLFVQGAGMALLQTAANPYVTILGPPESAAKRISIMGVCNGIAGIVAPLILGSIILENADEIQNRLITRSLSDQVYELDALANRVIVPYLIMAIILAILSFFSLYSSLPEIDTDHEDQNIAATNINKTSIFQFPHLLLGVVTLFLYVGVEVIAGDTIINYGASQQIPLYYAKYFTSATLSAMLIGYLIGIACIPRYFSQETALKVSAGMGILFVLGAIFTSGYVSVTFIALLGLANSLVWPAIWPLAIAGLGRFTKIGSSMLIMAVAGGALIPLLYGHFADIFNPRDAYWIVVPCYMMIGYYAFYGHKIRRA